MPMVSHVSPERHGAFPMLPRLDKGIDARQKDPPPAAQPEEMGRRAIHAEEGGGPVYPQRGFGLSDGNWGASRDG
jgi:hypothetical protein